MAHGKLIILRGNAGSGKSTVAAQLRASATRPTAVIEQDYYRHQLLSPWDEKASSLRSQLMVRDVRFLLAEGCTVIVEGVLPSKWFRAVYEEIGAKDSYVYYFDIPFEETVRRHASRGKVVDFGEEVLRSWWQENDVLGVAGERRIDQESSIDDTVGVIRRVAGL